jgi:hypothetical protein
LFARPDFWQVMLKIIDVSSSELDPEADFNDNARILLGLERITKVYGYPAIRKQIQGHERQFIAAHITALERISVFYKGVAAKDIVAGANYNYLKFASSPKALVNSALLMGDQVNAAQAKAARQSLLALQPDDSQLAAREGLLRFIDQGITELRRLAD